MKSRLTAGVALGVLREIGERESSGLAKWGTAATYRGTPITTVTGHEGHSTITLYYGLTADALVFALSEGALHVAVDELLDMPPVPLDPKTKDDPSTGQAVFDLAGAAGSPLYRALSWGATRAFLDETNDAPSLAEAVLRGDPGAASRSPRTRRAVFRAVFGSVPLTLEGKEFTLGPDGIGFPPRGSASSPVFPELPFPAPPSTSCSLDSRASGRPCRSTTSPAPRPRKPSRASTRGPTVELR